MEHQSSPWHSGEVAIQTRAGSRDRVEELGQRMIRPIILAQQKAFIEQLGIIIVGCKDALGRIQARALFGQPGFAHAPTEKQLSIRLTDFANNPAFDWVEGQRVGILGIDFTSRRRIRINGVVASITATHMVLDVLQCYGNCPQHITVRQPRLNPDYGPPVVERVTDLTAALLDTQQIDTVFIASGVDDTPTLNGSGCDVSHRGGPPGFITTDSMGRIILPDFPGNGFFNTLGNLQINPYAGLLFLDFKEGHILHLSVTTEILWQQDAPTVCGDWERVLRFTIMEGFKTYNAMPFLFSAG